MNTIVNYGLQNYSNTNTNTNYENQQTNFKANGLLKQCKKTPQKLENNLREKIVAFVGKISEPFVIIIEPAKDYKELSSLLKSNIRAKKVSEFLNKLMLAPINLSLPKEMRYTSTTQELIDAGYEFAQKNKDKLDKLTYKAVEAGNSDYLKGMLKAMEEWGITK